MTSLRVLLVIYEGSDDAEQSVTAKNWMPMLRALTNQGLALKIVLLGQPRHACKAFREDGYDVVALGSSSIYSSILHVGELYRIVRRFRPDVIHAHEVIPATLAGIVGRFSRVCPLIFHRQHALGSKRLEVASRLATRLTRFTFAVSEPIRRYAIDLDKRDPSLVWVTHNGSPGLREVSEEEIESLRRDLGIPAGAAVVVVVARLRPKKNHSRMIAATEVVAKQSVRDIHLVLVGSGPERETLEKISRETTVPVHLVGHHSDVAPWFALADVAALPSLYDPCPFSGIETLSAGTPLLGANVDGIPEIVGDDAGILVDPQDVEQIAQGLSRLLDDPDRRRKMSAAAKRRFEAMFTTDQVVDRWITCYREVLDVCRYGG